LWNIDVHLCSYVNGARRQLGYPFGVLLELHGWWHILTAIASYVFMALIEFLTVAEHDETHGKGFFWPVKEVLEDLAPRKLANGEVLNGSLHANGSAKKKT
jgi:dihydroceramidase